MKNTKIYLDWTPHNGEIKEKDEEKELEVSDSEHSHLPGVF